MQHGEEDGPVDSKREAPFGQELLEHCGAARLLPEPLEDERGAQAQGAHGGKLAALVRRHDQEFVGEAGAGAEQAVDGAALLQVVEAAEGSEDSLPRSAVVPVVGDELEVGAWAGLFGTEEPGGLRCRATMSVAGVFVESMVKCGYSPEYVALCFSPGRWGVEKPSGFHVAPGLNWGRSVEDESEADLVGRGHASFAAKPSAGPWPS